MISSTVTRTAALPPHPLLDALGGPVRQRLLDGLGVSSTAPGSTLDRCGSGILLLLEGAVREALSDPEGREVLIDLTAAPAVLGLESIIGDDPPRWTAQKRSAWIEVPGERVAEVSRASPELSLLLLETAGRVLERRRRLLYSLAFEPVRVRLARLIAGYLEVFGVPVGEGLALPVAFTHLRLAQDLGVTTRSIDRALSVWLRQGWLARRGGRLIVRSVPSLLEAADVARA